MHDKNPNRLEFEDSFLSLSNILSHLSNKILFSYSLVNEKVLRKCTRVHAR